MKRLVIIDNGHGADTPGKKSTMPNGLIFEEWEFNRIIKLKLVSILERNNYPYYDLVPECRDVSLIVRANRANSLAALYKEQKPFLISIHGDAFSNKKVNGVTVFSSKGKTGSDKNSTILVENLKGLGFSNRYDIDSEGNKGREADFYILKNTTCEANLVELGFYTNDENVMQMHDDIFQEKIAQLLYKSILEINKI